MRCVGWFRWCSGFVGDMVLTEPPQNVCANGGCADGGVGKLRKKPRLTDGAQATFQDMQNKYAFSQQRAWLTASLKLRVVSQAASLSDARLPSHDHSSAQSGRRVARLHQGLECIARLKLDGASGRINRLGGNKFAYLIR